MLGRNGFLYGKIRFKHVIVVIVIAVILLCVVINRAAEIEENIIYTSVASKNFRVSIQRSKEENADTISDYVFDLSIEYLNETGEAILYHMLPPYTVTLTSLETNEEIGLFDRPAIEKNMRITTSDPYSARISLMESLERELSPGGYNMDIFCAFDFIETVNGTFDDLSFLEKGNAIERQSFSCDISFLVTIK